MAKLSQELARQGLTPSMAAARRMIRLGGVRVDGGITMEDIEVPEGAQITLRKAKGRTDIHKTVHDKK